MAGSNTVASLSCGFDPNLLCGFFLPAKQADRHASRIPIHEGLSGVHLPISATIARECITPKRKLSLRAYPPLLASAKDGGITSRKEFSLEALIQVI